MAMMTTICSQIALYVQRKWAGEELDQVFRLSLDLFCVATFDGYFVRLNNAWQTVLGFSEAELRATPFMEFVHPEDRRSTISAMSALLTGGTGCRIRKPVSSQGRQLQVAAVGLRAICQQQGLVYATARDVTDRKLAAKRA